MIRKSVQNLTPYTPGEQPKIPNLIKLNTNENAYPPSPKVAEAMHNFDFNKLRLYPDPLCIKIREQLAEKYNCSIDNIFVGNGSDEVLRVATYAYLEDDGLMGYFDPSYSLYPVLADIRVVEHQAFPLPSEADLSSCLASVERKPDLFVIANPNAPTSTIFSKFAMKRFCESFNGVVVIDEAYVDFAENNCVELALTMPNVVVCQTLSKGWSLAGVRLGYMIGPKDLIEALYKIKDSYNVNFLTQAVAEATLSDPGWMKVHRNKIVATRSRLQAALRDLGWTVADSATNFLWCTPPAPHTAKGVQDLLREHGIIVRHFKGATTENFIRITIGTDEQTNTLLEVLRKAHA